MPDQHRTCAAPPRIIYTSHDLAFPTLTRQPTLCVERRPASHTVRRGGNPLRDSLGQRKSPTSRLDNRRRPSPHKNPPAQCSVARYLDSWEAGGGARWESELRPVRWCSFAVWSPRSSALPGLVRRPRRAVQQWLHRSWRRRIPWACSGCAGRPTRRSLRAGWLDEAHDGGFIGCPMRRRPARRWRRQRRRRPGAALAAMARGSRMKRTGSVARWRRRPAHGRLDACMGVGDDQLDPAQAATGQFAQELRQEVRGFRGLMSMPSTSRPPSKLTPTAMIKPPRQSSALAHLHIGGVDPDIGLVALDRALQVKCGSFRRTSRTVG